MPDIRYVCLSDLHLGAANSVLTNLAYDGAHVSTPGPLLHRMLRGLKQLLADLDTTTPPTLVVHGDLFELALTSTELAADTFGHFVFEAWGDPDRPLFAPEVLFVPGNHDHHLWEITRQRQYEGEIDATAGVLAPMRHVTSMRRDHPSTAAVEPFIGEMARRALAGRSQAPAPTFRVLYPNLGLLSDDGERAVVVTHGHYLEPMYRAMTQLHNVVIPRRPPRLDVGQIEADNWAWIDFFWSTMGRSGEGENSAIPILYELLQSEEAIEAVVARVVDDLLPRSRSVVRRVERLVARRAAQEVCTSVARRERHQPALLSPEATEGLTNYLAGPVKTQMTADFELDHVPRRVDLVFGHTHKPFASRRYGVRLPRAGGGPQLRGMGGRLHRVGADEGGVGRADRRRPRGRRPGHLPPGARAGGLPGAGVPRERSPRRADAAAPRGAGVAGPQRRRVGRRGHRRGRDGGGARRSSSRIGSGRGTLAVRTEPPVGPRGW